MKKSKDTIVLGSTNPMLLTVAIIITIIVTIITITITTIIIITTVTIIMVQIIILSRGKSTIIPVYTRNLIKKGNMSGLF
jgi:hypothetical protein